MTSNTYSPNAPVERQTGSDWVKGKTPETLDMTTHCGPAASGTWGSGEVILRALVGTPLADIPEGERGPSQQGAGDAHPGTGG